MPKDLASLKKSRHEKEQVLQYLGTGGLPESIITADWRDRALDKFIVGPSDVSANKTGIKAFDFSFDGAATISRFPINVGRKLLLFYTEEGARVLDPFAGHNSRMEFCVRAGREYWASDIQPEYMEFNRQTYDFICSQPRLIGEWPPTRLVTGDSRRLPFEDNSCDFMITSPPYWDQEFYGDQPEQLYYCQTYEGFLFDLMSVFRECSRILKPGAFGAVFVNDFRKDMRYYAYHADCMARFPDVGLDVWDLVIVDLGRATRSTWVSQALQQQIIPKRHEYAIIVRKPTGKKKEKAYDRRKLSTMPQPIAGPQLEIPFAPDGEVIDDIEFEAEEIEYPSAIEPRRVLLPDPTIEHDPDDPFTVD